METTIRDTQLSFARKVRRVGCISKRDGNQIRSQAISDADDADLLLRCVICFVRLRYLVRLSCTPILPRSPSNSKKKVDGTCLLVLSLSWLC